MRIIAICPSAHVGDANHLAMALGDSVEAWQDTFATVGWRAGSEGQAVACWDADPAWLVAVQSVPERPAWDADTP